MPCRFVKWNNGLQDLFVRGIGRRSTERGMVSNNARAMANGHVSGRDHESSATGAIRFGKTTDGFYPDVTGARSVFEPDREPPRPSSRPLTKSPSSPQRHNETLLLANVPSTSKLLSMRISRFCKPTGRVTWNRTMLTRGRLDFRLRLYCCLYGPWSNHFCFVRHPCCFSSTYRPVSTCSPLATTSGA